FWSLARQLMFGEFAGEDAGSPLATRVQMHTNTLTWLKPTGSLQPPLTLRDNVPLEMLIEAEPLTPASIGPLDSALAGLHYLRLLRATSGVGDVSAYRAGLLAAYPFPGPRPSGIIGSPPASDPTDLRLRAYVDRVPDGLTLYSALHAVGM